MSPLTAIARLVPSALLVVAAACGDKVTYVECPLGTRPEGSLCVPLDAGPDASSPTQDTTPPSDDSVTPPDTSAPDASAPDTAQARGTGATCARNADCLGGTCLDWTGGYCTQLDCDTSGCGQGEVCLPFSGNHICTRECAVDADCGSPDQACKRLPVGDALVAVCVGVDTDAGGTSSPCSDPTDCRGGAACLPSFPGGYCAVLGCPEARCALDSACVRVDGVPSCLLACSGDAQCGGSEGAERRCGTLQSIANEPVGVCISGVEGKGLGESCRSDFECSTGTCQVLGEGRCSQTGRPCSRPTAQVDCNTAEFCQVQADSRVGVCSQPCGVGALGCPGAAHCVAEGQDGDGAWCRPACTGPSDATCNGAVGLACTFGIPISDSGQGRYACALARPGTPRAACTGDANCGGTCLLDGAAGYCTPGCGDDAYCPFGGSCVFGAPDACLRVCFSSADCPAGFTCGSPPGAVRPVCIP
jgi:hypothetical protein